MVLRTWKTWKSIVPHVKEAQQRIRDINTEFSKTLESRDPTRHVFATAAMDVVNSSHFLSRSRRSNWKWPFTEQDFERVKEALEKETREEAPPPSGKHSRDPFATLFAKFTTAKKNAKLDAELESATEKFDKLVLALAELVDRRHAPFLQAMFSDRFRAESYSITPGKAVLSPFYYIRSKIREADLLAYRARVLSHLKPELQRSRQLLKTYFEELERERRERAEKPRKPPPPTPWAH